MDTVNESLTTVVDGDTTVNERLSPGGKGPEGQPDTATESITTAATDVPTTTTTTTEEDGEAEAPKRRKQRS